MEELKIMEQFTVEDIRKLRERNALRHQKMSATEIVCERRKAAKEFLESMVTSERAVCIA